MKKFIPTLMAVLVLGTALMADGSEPMPCMKNGKPVNCPQVR